MRCVNLQGTLLWVNLFTPFFICIISPLFLAPVIKTTLQGSGEVFGSVELCCRNQKNIVQ